MVPEAISSRQCSANTPIQGQSNANRDPVLDWRFLVNPRKSRSILCNANTNSVPIGAQTNSSSVANPRPIGANPLPIHCQSGANPLPIRCQSDVSQLSRSFANRVIIWCQSFANRVPIECQSIANPLPIRSQSDVSELSQSFANRVPILGQLSANRVPIRCRLCANPFTISADPSPIKCQSSANPVPIECQSGAKPVPIRCQPAQTIHRQSSTNLKPIKGQSVAIPS